MFQQKSARKMWSRKKGTRTNFLARGRSLCEALESRLLLSTTWYPDLQNLVVPSDNPVLPLAMDVFAPPVNSQTPAGGAPQLAEVTRTANPGDVLALTGYQLSSLSGTDFGKGTQFIVYGQHQALGGVTGAADILRLDADNIEAAITVPTSMLSDSMYLVWAQNGQGVSYPFAVNRTEAWWTGPDTATRGDTVSVYGRNLTYYGSTYTGTNLSWIYLKPTGGGAGQWVTPTTANPYKVDFTVPASLTNGIYEVWVHNGHGGKYGWSRSGTNLTVSNPVTWSANTFNVKSYGAVGDGVADDTTAIQTAIYAAQDWDTIYFPAGTYRTTASFTIPAKRRIQGAGMATATWKATKVTLAGNDAIESVGIECQQGLALTGPQFWITNASISETGGDTYNIINLGGFDHVYLKGSTFIGNKVGGVSHQVFIDSCNFYARFDAEDCIESWGADQISITRNTFQHYDTSNPNDWSGWGEGRAWVGYCHWGSESNQYFGGNSTKDFVVRPGADQNSGEQLLWEGSYIFYTGAVTGATATTVSFDPGSTTPDGAMRVVVVDGKGMGQVRAVASYNASTKTITLAEPWNVIPDTSSSRIELERFPDKIAVYQNSFDGTQAAVQTSDVACAGVDTFWGGANMIVDNNTFHEMRYGVRWESWNGRTFSSLVANNTYDNVRWAYAQNSNSSGLPVIGASSLLNVWRGNTVLSAYDRAVWLTGTSGNTLLTVVAGNVINNAPIGVDASAGANAYKLVLAKNSFSRGTAALAGSIGLNGGSGLSVTLRDNTWTGFATTYGGTAQGATLETPARLLELNAVSGTVQTTVSVWDAGASALPWSMASDSTWLTYAPASDTVETENLADTITVTCNTSGLSTGVYNGTLTLTGNGQTKKIAVTFTVGLKPTISGYTQSGPVLTSGAVITVNGTNFVSGATARIGGNTAATVTFVSSTQLQVTLPTMTPTDGIYALEIINPNGLVAAAAAGVGYGRYLASVTPGDVQIAGGGQVTVYGAGFEATTTFKVGGVNATGITIVSSRQATITVPAGAAVGLTTLTAATGGAAFSGSPKLGYAAPYLSPYFGATGVAAAQTKYNTAMYADYKSYISYYAANFQSLTAGLDEVNLAVQELSTLLWAYLLEGKPAYRDQVMAEAAVVAGEGFPGGGHMPEMKAQHMAMVYNALGAELTASERTMFETYLNSVINGDKVLWGYNVQGRNTVAVTSACGGLAGLALLHTGNPNAQAAVDWCANNLSANYLNQSMQPDGGVAEGTLYWNYGMWHYLMFANALQQRTGSDRGLLSAPCLQNNVHFVETMLAGDPITAMQTFSDTQPALYGASVAAALGGQFNQPLQRWLADTIMHEAAGATRPQTHYGEVYNTPSGVYLSMSGLEAVLAFAWRDGVASPAQCPALPTLSVLNNNTQWGAMRTDSARYPDMVVAVHGGQPPITDHSNYDAGSFVLQANQDAYLIDPGYLAGYAMDGHQDYHSLPLVDGNGVNDLGVANITTSWEDSISRGIVIDSTQAYLNSAANRVRRTMVMTQVLDQGEAMILLDDIVAAGAGAITAQYQAGFATSILDNHTAVINGTNGRLEIATFGPAVTLSTVHQTWGTPWLFTQRGINWNTLKATYTANVNQPLITVLMPTGSSGNLPAATVQYGAGVIDVTLPAGKVLRFTQTAGVWSYTGVVGPATPLVSVYTPDPMADEQGQDPATFGFYRAGATTNSLVVQYTIGGTAASGDYTPTLSGSVTIPAGSASATITITPVDDATNEIDEYLTLTVTDTANYDLLAGHSAATATIMDNDGTATVSVTASDPNATEAGPTTGTYLITRNKLRPGSLTVNYAMSGAAGNGTDYQTLAGVAVIPDGQLSVAVTVTPIQDGVVESAETATLTVTSGTGYTVGAPSTADITITDLGVQNTMTWTGGGGDGKWSNSANWSRSGTHPVPDYGDLVVIPSTASNAVMTQDIPNLLLYGLTVTQSNAGATRTLNLGGNLTVADGNSATIPLFNITAGNFIFNLGAYAFGWDNAPAYYVDVDPNMTITLAGGSLGTNDGKTPIRVLAGGKISGYGSIYGTCLETTWTEYGLPYKVLDLEAGGTIEVGDGILNFADGAGLNADGSHPGAYLLGTIQGTTVNSQLWLGNAQMWGAFWDMVQTGSQTQVKGLNVLDISAGNWGLGRFGGNSTQADLANTTLVQARSNFAPPNGVWQYIEALTTSDDITKFKIGQLRVDSNWYDTNPTGFKLMDTGAVNGDFVYAGTLANIGGLNARIDLNGIALLTDMTQADLQAVLTNNGFINSGAGGAPTIKSVVVANQVKYYVAPASVTIPQPVGFTISATDASASEQGTDPGTFTITRIGPTTGAVTVYYTLGGTAAGSDYNPALSGSIVMPDGQTSATITITPVDDALAENDETLVVTLSTNAAYQVGMPNAGTVTIADNEPRVTITATDPNAAEQGQDPGTFTVTRANSTSGALTVNYTIGGTATNTTDYTTLTGSVVIANGQSSATITLTPVDDATFEPTETVLLTLAAGSGYSIGTPNTATATIADNDGGNLISWLQMDDSGDMTASDSSVYGNNAALAIGTAWTTDTATGTGAAVSFDGANGYATLSANSSLNIGNNLTLSMWIKGNAPTGFPRFFDNCAGGYGLQMQASMNSSQISLIINTSGGTGQGVSLNNVLTNSWNHIAFTLSSGTVKTYLNGTLVSTGSYNHGGGFGNTNPWILGAMSDHTCNFAGKLDNFRVYNTVLNDTAIGNLYNAERSSAPAVTISATDANASEAGPDNGVFTVTRAGTSGDIVVNYTVTGTATNGTDYSSLSGSVAILNGQNSATITIAPVDDSSVENNETVLLTLASGTGYSIGSPANATVTITENDTATASITATDAAASEASSDPGTFRVSLAAAAQRDLTINYSITGTAASSDYNPSLPGTVTILAGQTSAVITITPVDDALIEGSETLILTLATGLGYTVGTPSNATVTIADNDSLLPQVSISATDANASEAGTDPGTFRVSRDTSSGSLVVYYTVSGTTSSGDYTPSLAGSVSIPNGQTYADLTITPVDDALVEGNETLILTLSSNAAYTIGSPANATINIADNDSSGGTLVAWLKMDDSGDSTADDASGYGNNATLVNGVAWTTDTPNGTGSALSFDGVNDYASLGNASSLNIGNNLTLSMWIKGASPAGFPRLFDNVVGGYGLQMQAIMSSSQVQLFINTSGGSGQSVTISNVLTNSWNHLAFTLASGTLKAYLNGSLVSTTSYVHGGGFGNTNPWILGALSDHTCNFAGKLDNFRVYNTVLDDTAIGTLYSTEAASTPTVTISATDANASETGPDTGVFTLTRTGTSGDLVINYTIAGSATNTSDYTTLASSVTIPNGSTSATIIITPVNDSTVENNETVLLTLTSGTGYTVGTPNSATVTIADNDTATASITATDPAAAEAATDPGTFRISLAAVAQKDLTINYSVTGTAVSGDYNPSLSGSVTIPAGQTYADLTITPIDDALVEGSETLILTLTSGTGYTVGSPSTATVTIADNDGGNLVAWLQMNDGSGTTATDASGYANNGTLVNGVAWTTDTPLGTGNALSFDGVNDYANLGNSSNLSIGNNLTLSLWVKAAAQTSSSRLFCNVTSGNGLEIQAIQGTSQIALLVSTSGGAGQSTTVNSVLTNAWNHLAFTLASGTLKAYLNGTLLGTYSYTHGGGFANSNAWILGAISDFSHNFTGKLDNFRVYNTVLDDTAIGTLYNAERPGTPAVTLSATDASAAEAGLDTGVFTITRPTAGADLVVNYTITGTATNGTDYTTIASSVTIPNGQTSATITITPTDDTLIEGSETVILTLASGSGYTIGAPSSGTVTLADNDLPSITITATDPNAAEAGADPGTFTVTRNGSGPALNTGNLVVNYTITGTASISTDYTSLSGSVTIPNGQSSATIVVTPVDDAIVENGETVVLTLTTGTGYTVGTPVNATVTIADNDTATASITATDASASEAGTDPGTFRISLAAVAQKDLTINYSLTGTAAGTDYNPSLSGSVVITAGQTYADITITPVDDSLVENNETVILTLTSGTGYTVGAPSTATVTITDNDTATASITATDAAAAEAATDPGTFRISLAAAAQKDLTINYSVTGTAAGTDYNPTLSGSVTIPAGQTYADLTITPVNDTIVENNETVILTLTSGTGYTVGAPSTATVTITDNDTATASITATDPAAAEAGTDPGIFRVSLAAAAEKDLTINYSVTGTAASSDYTPTLSGSVTIPAGQTYADLTLTPVNDTIVENNETVILTLTSGTGYTVGAPPSATVTITDNDTVTATIAATDASASEAGTDPGTFRISLAAAAEKNLTINYSVTGTAASSDYNPSLSGSVTITAGQTYADVTITPVDDSTVESTETVILTLTAGTGYTIGSPSNATVTIADNDGSNLVAWLKMDDGTGTTATDASGYGNNGTLVNGTAWSTDTATGTGDALSFDGTNDYLSISSASNLNIGNNITLSMWIKGSAPAGFPRLFDNVVGGYGLQMQAVQGNSQVQFLVFTSGGNGQSTTVNNVLTNSWNHLAFTLASGTIKVYLNGSLVSTSGYTHGGGFGNTNPWILGALSDHTCNFAGKIDNFRVYNTVLDDTTIGSIYTAEAATSPTVTLSATDAAASETGPDNGVFTVTRTGSTSSAMTVNFTIGGSATNTSDYSTLTTSVTIASGQSSATITITPVNDSVVENNETVILTLASGSGYTIGSPSSDTVTITDNDTATASITATDAAAAEASSDPGTFRISLAAAAEKDLTINYSVTGTAASTDYNPTLSGSVTIPAGQTYADLTITPVNDTIVENNETVILTLTSGTGYTVGAPSNATVTITDNDTATASITATDAAAAEAATDPGTFRISLAAAAQKDLTINYSVTGTAASGDYTPSLSGSVTITAGQTYADITITPVDDSTVESSETVILTLTAGTGYTVGSPSTATVTITDNDTATASITATDAAAAEASSDPGTFRISLAAAAQQNLTINYSITGTAASSDYTPSLSGSVTIPAGQTYADLTITPVDDALVEGSETVILTLTSGTGYTVGAPSNATVTIADNDGGNLVAWLKMDDSGDTTADDASGFGNNATLVNGVAWTTDTPTGTGSALNFDGADDYASLGNASSLNIGNNLTLSLWIKAPAQTGFPRFFDNVVGGYGLQIQAVMNTSQVQFLTFTSGGNSSVTVNNVLTNSWNHLAFTLANGTIKTYLNGSLVSTNGYTHGSGFGNTNPWILGALSDHTCNFAGKIDNFRVYNTVLDDTAVGTVYNAEHPSTATVTITATDPTAAEVGSDSGTFTITRTTSSGDLVVNYTITGTAANGTDYSNLLSSVTIPNGQTSAAIVVTPIDDSAVENNETVILTLASGAGYTVGAPANATVTITDNDTATASITATDPAAAEAGADPGTFRISLAAAAQKDLTINYSVTGTATNGTDYNPTLSGSVTITAGQTYADLTLTPVDDGVIEGSETAILTLTSGTGYTVGSPSTATVTIADNDNQALWLKMDDGTGTTATDASGNGNNATLVNGTAWTTDTPTGAGNALSFDGVNDYANLGHGSTLNIGNNLTLSMWIKAPTQTAFQRLFDNTVSGGYGLQIQAVQGSSQVTLLVSTSGGISQGTSVNNVLNNSWNHLAFTLASGTLKVYLNGTLVTTGSYTHGSGFGNTNDWILGALSDHTCNFAGKIDNVRAYSRVLNDTEIGTVYTAECPPTVTITATDATAAEPGADTGTFTVTRTTSSGALTVNYTIGGSATNTNDYTTITSSVTIPNGSTSATITITPADDAVAELKETVKLTLATGTGYTIGSPNNATVTIADNDTLALPTTLTALWRFDEGSGTTAYDSADGGTADNGTLQSTPTSVTGKIGKALQFNGSTQYVQINNSTDLNITGSLTIACWAKSGTANWNAAQTFISKRDAYILGPVNNSSKSVQFQLYISGAWKTVSYTPTFDITQWHHYAATYNGSTMLLYVDGTQVATQSQSGAIASDTGVLTLGRDDGQSRYLNGSLDEVRIYNTALNATAISALNSEAALSVTGLTVNSANSSSYSLQSYTLATGLNQYGDAANTFTTVPGKYLGSTFIRTADTDKTSTGDQLLGFTLNRDCQLYVAFDDAITSKPTWLTGSFTDTGDNLVTTAGTFSIYKAGLTAGTIWLGGNTTDGSSTGHMYSVLLLSLL